MTLRGDGLVGSINNILVYLIGAGIVAIVVLSWNTSIGIAEIKGSMDSFRSADTVNSQRIDKIEVRQSLLEKQVADDRNRK